jgi:hypothetical protein
MRTNANITLYSRQPGKDGATYQRCVIRGVQWQGELRARVVDKGLATADSVKIFVPLSAAGAVVFRKGDLIVKGAVEFDLTGKAFGDLRREHPESFEIISARKRDNGSPRMRHWQLEAV